MRRCEPAEWLALRTQGSPPRMRRCQPAEWLACRTPGSRAFFVAPCRYEPGSLCERNRGTPRRCRPPRSGSSIRSDPRPDRPARSRWPVAITRPIRLPGGPDAGRDEQGSRSDCYLAKRCGLSRFSCRIAGPPEAAPGPRFRAGSLQNNPRFPRSCGASVP